MEHSTVKNRGILPIVIVSLSLFAVTFATNNVHASQVTQAPMNGTELARWGGGGWGHGGGWGGGWHHGGNWGGYYGGWGGYYAPAYYGCVNYCWINRWGYQSCACY